MAQNSLMSEREINQTYLDFPKSLVGEWSESGRIPLFLKFKAVIRRTIPYRVRSVIYFILRWHERIRILILLILVSATLGSCLKMFLWIKTFKTKTVNDFNKRAAGYVREFVEQYPFHLYPIVCKSFEFAFFADEVTNLLNQRASFLEIAIGEGTFSSRIFPKDTRVVGLDISPYSLKKAGCMPHISKAIICDCLEPPIDESAFDVLLANNFLHHVTDKEGALKNWAKISKKIIFNENTPYWASGWVAPYITKKLGLKKFSTGIAKQIEAEHRQCLRTQETIEEILAKDYEVCKKATYMSEQTFFYCAIFSFLLGCTGPPTPSYLKDWFLSKPLRRLILPLTAKLAELLVYVDQYQDRDKDTYISYICESRSAVTVSRTSFLICPECKEKLENDECKRCAKKYSTIDGMLFLLPDKLEFIQQGYNPFIADATLDEHL